MKDLLKTIMWPPTLLMKGLGVYNTRNKARERGESVNRVGGGEGVNLLNYLSNSEVYKFLTSFHQLWDKIMLSSTSYRFLGRAI